MSRGSADRTELLFSQEKHWENQGKPVTKWGTQGKIKGFPKIRESFLINQSGSHKSGKSGKIMRKPRERPCDVGGFPHFLGGFVKSAEILTKCSGDLSAALRMINGSSPLIRA